MTDSPVRFSPLFITDAGWQISGKSAIQGWKLTLQQRLAAPLIRPLAGIGLIGFVVSPVTVFSAEIDLVDDAPQDGAVDVGNGLFKMIDGFTTGFTDAADQNDAADTF